MTERYIHSARQLFAVVQTAVYQHVTSLIGGGNFLKSDLSPTPPSIHSSNHHAGSRTLSVAVLCLALATAAASCQKDVAPDAPPGVTRQADSTAVDSVQVSIGITGCTWADDTHVSF